MFHESVVQHAVRPSIKPHLPNALTSKYYLMVLNVPTSFAFLTYLFTGAKMEKGKDGSSLGITMSHILHSRGSCLACFSRQAL